MNGQWIGSFEGTSQGLLVVDIDDIGDYYAGTATAIGNNSALPPVLAVLPNIPKNQKQITLRGPLLPIDRQSGKAVQWVEISNQYGADVTVPTYADVRFELENESLGVQWTTDIGTTGHSTLRKSRAEQPSALVPVADVTTWDKFRRFARELPPYRYIFRGQSGRLRLRTSFHRTGRTSLHRFELQDIPALHRHLSGTVSHPFDLRDPLQNAAFYNLIQHHGYPTPLLDWTYSPFIAAFFAFKTDPRRKIGGDDHVRIFVFDKTDWSSDFQPQYLITPAMLNFTLLEPLALNNPRVVPQQSVSSVTNVDDIEEYLQLCEGRARKQYLRAIDLPISERSTVLQELGLMGITAGSLFPGIDGACEELRYRFFGI